MKKYILLISIAEMLLSHHLMGMSLECWFSQPDHLVEVTADLLTYQIKYKLFILAIQCMDTPPSVQRGDLLALTLYYQPIFYKCTP